MNTNSDPGSPGSCVFVKVKLCSDSPPADEGDQEVRRFMREVGTQWRSLSMEVRSVKSMLEEVLSNWEKYGSTVASLQAWLEDAEEALDKPENVRRVRESHLTAPFHLPSEILDVVLTQLLNDLIDFSKSPRVFQLSRCHGYYRYSSPPRIRRLITLDLSPLCFSLSMPPFVS